MHDQPSDRPALEEDDRNDAAVLHLLLEPDLRAPLSIDELTRQIGDELAVVDALARLHGSGLIHRCDTFVFATEAARRFDQLTW
jgi:predicted transcriptional regulator